MAATIAPNPQIAPSFQAGMQGRNTVEAPVPATMSPQLAAQRRAPIVTPASSPIRRPRTMAPIAAAQAAYTETGDPLSAFASGWVNASAVREEDAAEQAKREEAAKALEGHADLQKYVASGVMEIGDAIRIGSTRDEATSKTQAADARKAEISQALGELAAKDPRYAPIAEQFDGGLVDEDGVSRMLLDVDKASEAPNGYRYGTDGNLEAIPGGPADPANPLNDKKVEEEGGERKLSAAEIKELFAAQDGITAGEATVPMLKKMIDLNQSAWDGPIADVGTQAGALLGDSNSADTQELKNLTTAQALEQLKAVFGAMPTEGERKILLEIQGSVGQQRDVRLRIYERALAAAKRRIESNRMKAEGIQTGKYKQPGYNAVSPADGPNLTGLSDDELLQQLAQ